MFAVPGESEASGQVVRGAQASGIPVIAFHAEGVCDIIQDGRTGWLVPVAKTGETGERIPRINIPNSGSEFEKEVTNFEKSIYAAVEMDERRGSAGVEAIRWARTWRWSEATEKAVDTYREVIC